MKNEFADTNWTLSKTWIQHHLGDSWSEAYEIYPRAVAHVCTDLASCGEVNAELIAQIQKQLTDQLPKTLPEVIPFAVRYVWNKKQSEGWADSHLPEILGRFHAVSRLVGGGDWSSKDLESAVQESFKGT
jgi:hypothetical protein